MRRPRVRLLSSGVLAALLVLLALAAGPHGPGRAGADILGSGSLKHGLDLPFEAGGAEGEEQDPPEIVSMYGGIYEANAVVFCLDESRSMDRASRWTIQKREAVRAISELSSRTQFGIIFYGQDAHAFRNRLIYATPANKRKAIEFVNTRPLSLGTCLGKGVVKSLRMLKDAESDHRAVIVAGDGRPTVCPFVRGAGRNPQMVQALLQETLAANPSLKARVHTIYVGTSNDREDIQFMKDLAAIHRGTFRLATR